MSNASKSTKGEERIQSNEKNAVIEEIKNFMIAYNEDFGRMWKNEYCSRRYENHWERFCKDDDVIFIRPSGNPAGKGIFRSMMKNKDIVVESSRLISIESVRLFCNGNAAVVTHKRHDKFSYKGKLNDDIALFSNVLEKQPGGKWMIVFGTRASGQKPKKTEQPSCPSSSLHGSLGYTKKAG